MAKFFSLFTAVFAFSTLVFAETVGGAPVTGPDGSFDCPGWGFGRGAYGMMGGWSGSFGGGSFWTGWLLHILGFLVLVALATFVVKVIWHSDSCCLPSKSKLTRKK